MKIKEGTNVVRWYLPIPISRMESDGVHGNFSESQKSTYYPKVAVLMFTWNPISIVVYVKTGQRNTIYLLLLFCFWDRFVIWVRLRVELFNVKKENDIMIKNYRWAYVENKKYLFLHDKGVKKTSDHKIYTHLRVWVWNACKLHEISQLQLIKCVYWDDWIYINS